MPLTMFSWGYYGWGNATKELKLAFDSVEAARGYAPPHFVDVRISRSVRAPGFRDAAFEHVLGSDRYTWMPELGNLGVLTKEALQIAEPKAAEKLLNLAVQCKHRHQRVLFYCGCQFPGNVHDLRCHRVEVASLLLKAAASRGLPLSVVEWPGGANTQLCLEGVSEHAPGGAMCRDRLCLCSG
jgi:hypothetical protein